MMMSDDDDDQDVDDDVVMKISMMKFHVNMMKLVNLVRKSFNRCASFSEWI